ncbi:MAG: NAD-dependent epimerase/dehydratase family protein [Actinobacteria bacterium]|nr:NAD-dependent epimerase/dehydratase family protein [Actinomycetota bacterium]
MKKVLVTGGAGFVGSNLVRMLAVEYGCEVTVLDDLFTGRKELLEGIEHEFVGGSVLDADLLNGCMSGMDTVFHLAARNIIVSIERPREDMEVNIGGTFNVLEAALRNKVKKVVYASTCSVYGNPRHLPISEDEPPSFLNFYSVSKYAGECYCRTFYEVYDFPVAIVRYSNVYGYNQSPENPYCGVVGRFMDKALRGEPLPVHGDGEQTRDFTFVEDACRATVLAALSPKSPGEVYNVGTGVETSVNRLAHAILSLVGAANEVVHIDRRDIDNIRRRVLNVEKIRQHLKFFPSYTLEMGLRKTLDWHRNTYPEGSS